MKKLIGISDSIKYSLEEIQKLVNGADKYKNRIKKDTNKYILQIGKLVDDSKNLSGRYNSCCSKIESLYRRYLKKSVHHEKRDEFKEKVNKYKTDVVEMFSTGGTHVATFVEKLDNHEKTLSTLQDDLSGNRGGEVDAILKSFGETMTELNELRREIKSTLEKEKCFKRNKVSKDFEETIGKVGLFRM